MEKDPKKCLLKYILNFPLKYSKQIIQLELHWQQTWLWNWSVWKSFEKPRFLPNYTRLKYFTSLSSPWKCMQYIQKIISVDYIFQLNTLDLGSILLSFFSFSGYQIWFLPLRHIFERLIFSLGTFIGSRFSWHSCNIIHQNMPTLCVIRKNTTDCWFWLVSQLFKITHSFFPKYVYFFVKLKSF